MNSPLDLQSWIIGFRSKILDFRFYAEYFLYQGRISSELCSYQCSPRQVILSITHLKFLESCLPYLSSHSSPNLKYQMQFKSWSLLSIKKKIKSLLWKKNVWIGISWELTFSLSIGTICLSSKLLAKMMNQSW